MSGAFAANTFDEYAFDVDFSSSAALFVSVADIQRASGRDDEISRVLHGSLEVVDVINDTPNTCSFIAKGFTPTVGQRVIAALGGYTNPDRLFAGSILSVDQLYVGSPSNPSWKVSCADDTWKLGMIKVSKRYVGESATDIVEDLLTEFAPNFTFDNVEAALPTLDEISFTNETLSTCLTRIAKRIGGYWYCDYFGDIHFYITESVDEPDDLTSSHPSLKNFTIARDISQMVTRMLGECGGAAALTDVAAGETIIPLDSAPDTWYSDSGGLVASGPQRISYTGREEGGSGSLVGPGVGPSSAPTPSLAAGSGVTSGVHSFKVVFITSGTNHSLPGPASASIDVGFVPAPASAPTAGTPTYGVGPDAGNHYYAVSYVTAAGETTPSPVSGTITTVAAVTDPTTAPTVAVGPSTGFGFLDPGNSYTYKYTYGDAFGNETLPSSASSPAVTVTSTQRLALSGIPYSTDPRITRVYIYRSANGGGGPWTRTDVAFTGADNRAAYLTNSTLGGTFSVDDIEWTAEGAGAAAPAANATGTKVVPLTGIPVSPSALVLSKNVYGTAAGGSQLKLIANIAAAATTYNVTTIDSSLGANAPGSNTAAANQVLLTGIPIGSSTVTKREIYMTAAGGSTYKLAATINDNSTTSTTITTADGSLGADAPSSDTSGLAQPTGQVLAGSTTLLLAGTGNFRSGGGWAILGNGRQIIRYTGISSGTLTGIPASGPGAIVETVPYSSNVTAAPCLVGVPSSGDGSVLYTIPKGEPVNGFLIVDDLSAQADLAGLLDDGSDGVVEDIIVNNSLSLVELQARLTATLALRRTIEASISYQVGGNVPSAGVRNTKSGRTIVVDLPTPTIVADSFKIQEVRISNFQPALEPVYQVTASTNRFSFEDLLRQSRPTG